MALNAARSFTHELLVEVMRRFVASIFNSSCTAVAAWRAETPPLASSWLNRVKDLLQQHRRQRQSSAHDRVSIEL